MLFGHLLLAVLVDVGHADHPHTLGKSFGIGGIGFPSAAGAEDDDGYGFVDIGLQPPNRTFKVFFFLRELFRECRGCYGRSHDGKPHQSQKL